MTIGRDAMKTLSLEDSQTLQAIGILADILEGASSPGGLSTVLVSKALRQAVATKSKPAFEFATRAFDSLDPEIRSRVAKDADMAAHDAVELRSRVAGYLNTAPRKEHAPTGLLSALNLRNKRPKTEE